MKFISIVSLALFAYTAVAFPLSRRAASQADQDANKADAQALNAKFATLNANSPCTGGENACVNKGFATCSNNKFNVSPCAAGEECFALPLVNSRGTSITCDTRADAIARGGILADNGGAGGAANGTSTTTGGQNNGNNGGKQNSNTSANTGGGKNGGGSLADIRKQNAIDAQTLQDSFAKLNANSPCTSGQNACIKDQFAQCSGGKFSTSACAAGEKCFALPLVNKAGTSVTCDTQADRDARFAAAKKGQ